MPDEQDTIQPQENADTSQPYKFSDEQTKKKIKKHFSDINDVITENDIKNVKIPGKEKPARSRKPRKTPPTDKPDEPVQRKDTEDGAAGSPTTPWDIVNE